MCCYNCGNDVAYDFNDNVDDKFDNSCVCKYLVNDLRICLWWLLVMIVVMFCEMLLQ